MGYSHAKLIYCFSYVNIDIEIFRNVSIKKRADGEPPTLNLIESYSLNVKNSDQTLSFFKLTPFLTAMLTAFLASGLLLYKPIGHT